MPPAAVPSVRYEFMRVRVATRRVDDKTSSGGTFECLQARWRYRHHHTGARMKKQQVTDGTQLSEARAPKKTYTKPTATFVPLKLEERLLGCLKVVEQCRTAAAS